MEAAVDIGSKTVSKHQIQPECGENEQADTRREGQICFTKSNYQARTGTS